ncbi:LysR substrate-binding domain-containing protein [Nitratidesulfovibrio liaohensis]|uniref:LysR substrate-binding domain-containing protein n=1 Tax=Nitratidesulfovibrio liaohensis TaxID=2604158 RepID=A0ABY9R2V5_9BACT|nr:LysR substrate-binding domain-containing protein [Nitratidesulfovibrio liaohensis]WMW66083.1 LysR substrate-binding domain-containing protein [Nitratidesulfovibrio liaohensis]
MELRDLRTFAAVARLLSFHRAAAELNAAQSTVSARIAALETELGVRLFERLGRRVALTEAGERLVQYAAKLIDVEDEARAWVTGESRLRGLLTVRVPESLCAYRLPPVIAAFRRRHPEVALHLTACTLNGLEKDLRQGITDLAFVMADSVRGGDLNVEALGVEPLVLVAAPHHPLATRDRVLARDLHGVTLVLSTADCAYRTVIEEALAAEGVQPSAGLEFSSAAALRGCVASGVGVTLLPVAAVRDELRAGTLRALAWADQPFETAVLMVRHRGKWVSPYMDTFMELCRAAWANTAGDGVLPEASWDFPCPMADVATILEPPKSAANAKERPDSTGQPAEVYAVESPPVPSVPDAPDASDTPDTADTSDAPDTPDMPDGEQLLPLSEVSPEHAPEQPVDLTDNLLADEPDELAPDEHTPVALVPKKLTPDELTPDDEPGGLMNGQPDSSAVPWADSWAEQEFMDDADTGPETVWGGLPDMAPELDMAPGMEPETLLDTVPEMPSGTLPEAFRDLPWQDLGDCSGFDPTDGPCASEDDGPDSGMDMPPHAPVPSSLADDRAEPAPRAVPSAASMTPEIRQPSLWDMPATSGQPPVSAAPAPEASGTEGTEAPPAPHGQAQQNEQAAQMREHARPAPAERAAESAPEPSQEAPQWLSLLPPKR